MTSAGTSFLKALPGGRMDDELTPAQRFAKARGKYIEALLASTVLTHFEIRLGITMVHLHANFERFAQTGQLVCFAGQALMAAETAATVPGVRKGERHLVQYGYARRIRAGLGRGVATEFELTVPASPGSDSPLSGDQKRGAPVEDIVPNSSTTVPQSLNHGSAKRCTGAPPTLLKDSSEHTQSARGLTAWDELLGVLPERMTKISNFKRARALWGPKVRAFGANRLLDAARAYARDPVIRKQNHLPSLQTWLGEELFGQFLAGGKSDAAGKVFSWPGPPEIKTQLVEAAGEDFVGSYLDPAKWDPAGHRITPRTSTARLELLKYPQLWTRLGVAIGDALPLAERVVP